MARLRSRGFLPSHLLSRYLLFCFLSQPSLWMWKKEREREEEEGEATFLCSMRRRDEFMRDYCWPIDTNYINIVRSSYRYWFRFIYIIFYNLKQIHELFLLRTLFGKKSLKRNNYKYCWLGFINLEIRNLIELTYFKSSQLIYGQECTNQATWSRKSHGLSAVD